MRYRPSAAASRSADSEGEMDLRAIWRAFVLFGIFFVLLIAGWHELPGGESLLSWYVIIASVAVPAAIAWLWK
jgi:hypothetical protein